MREWSAKLRKDIANFEKELSDDNLPLAELKPAKNNVRQVKSDSEQMKQLVASIEAQGLLHNLVVMKNGKGYEVVDGNRRLAALRKIHGKTSEVEINCVEIDSTIISRTTCQHDAKGYAPLRSV